MNKLPVYVYSHVEGFINKGFSSCAVFACRALILRRALNIRNSTASEAVSNAFIRAPGAGGSAGQSSFEMN